MMKQIRFPLDWHRLLTATAVALAATAASAQIGPACGSLENNYGPYDYRGHEGSKHIVESNHFDSGVENLTRRMTGPFGGDIAYTLRAFPNHYRALVTLERLAEKEKADPPDSAKYKVECYYERALRFVPDDHIVRLLYASFLIRRQRLDEAGQHLQYVARTTQDNPFAQFNVGMLYADLKEYDKALVQAHRVIALGVDRRELKDRLVAAGRWVEPAAADAAASSPAPASAPASEPAAAR
ncbi:hypothetical protein [Roseateles sp.]|uniref:tetratricopeptide repeat protein n=1 Tax=Roseateles sp. TaxID=1971397 RepID=UPI00326796CF